MTSSPIVGEATIVVDATPAEVFDFVLDLDRYRLADHKIGPGRTHRNGSSGTVEFVGRLRGVPGPKGVYPYELTPTRVTVGSPIAGPARWFLDFEGVFDCEITDAGTRVLHRETFAFKRPWRWVAGPALRRWLPRDVEAEMRRFGALVDGDAAQAPSG